MKIKLLNLSIENAIVRFYLMTGVVILAGFSGQWWLAILGLPILISILVGFTVVREEVPVRGRMINMNVSNSSLNKAS